MFGKLQVCYQQDLKVDVQQIGDVFVCISFFIDIVEVVKGVDFVIEVIFENMDIKCKFYNQLGEVVDLNIIFVINFSILLFSQFMEEIGCFEKFLVLYFVNEIWKFNIVEIMCMFRIDDVVFDMVVQFVKDIGMVVLFMYKEQVGYILNMLLVLLLGVVLELVVKGIVDLQMVDKIWMIVIGVLCGLFVFLDVIGLIMFYNINMVSVEINFGSVVVVKYIKENYIDKGKLGIVIGEGFYKYFNLVFESVDFLK